MKNNFKKSTLIYKFREENDKAELDRFYHILEDLHINTATERRPDTNIYCQTVSSKEEIDRNIHFDTLVCFKPEDPESIYHVLKHKSLFKYCDRILVIYPENCENKFNHRHWIRKDHSETIVDYIRN